MDCRHAGQDLLEAFDHVVSKEELNLEMAEASIAFALVIEVDFLYDIIVYLLRLRSQQSAHSLI